MHKKKFAAVLTALLFIFQHAALAQDSAAVSWQATGKKIADKQYEITLTGTIKTGWHVYAKPIAAAEVEGFKITFSDSSIKQNGPQQLTGNFKTITDKNFDTQAEVAETKLEVIQKITITSDVPSKLKATLLYNTASSEAFIPEEKKIEILMEGGIEISASSNRILIPTIDLKNPVNKCGGTGITAEESTAVNHFYIRFFGRPGSTHYPLRFSNDTFNGIFFHQKGHIKKAGHF
jgi:hypothetical protein